MPTQVPPDVDRLFTTEQAAAITGLHPATISRAHHDEDNKLEALDQARAAASTALVWTRIAVNHQANEGQAGAGDGTGSRLP